MVNLYCDTRETLVALRVLFMARLPACFVRGHPTRNVLLRLTLDVIAEVLPEAIERFAPAAVHRSPSARAGRNMRAMAPASRFHLVVSTASCRRPAAVSR